MPNDRALDREDLPHPPLRVQRFVLKTKRPNLVSLIQRMTNQLAIALDKSGLGVDLLEAHVLAQLSETGTSTYAEMHRAIGHRRSVLTGTLDRLEARRLLTRKLSDVDRGSLILELTAIGRPLARQVQTWLRHFESDLLAHLEGEDVEGVEAVARALSKVMVALATPPAP